MRAWLRIFLPFAAGYFLSYLLRNANAVIAPELTRQLGLSAADLGLLTSAYLLAFGAFQLPLGILLDRHGPRRVESGLLLLAAAGSAAFALGGSLPQLAVARAAIGLVPAGPPALPERGGHGGGRARRPRGHDTALGRPAGRRLARDLPRPRRPGRRGRRGDRLDAGEGRRGLPRNALRAGARARRDRPEPRLLAVRAAGDGLGGRLHGAA